MLDFRKEDIIIFSLIFILFIISVFIIKSFIILLIFSLLLVYILNPIYKKLKSILKFHSITAILIIIIFTTLFIFPVTYAIIQMSTEISKIEDSAIEKNLNTLSEKTNKVLNIKIDFTSQYYSFISNFQEFTKTILLKIPRFIFEIFIITFFYYYFSKGYSEEIKFFRSLLNREKFKNIKLKLEKLLDGIVYGQILVRIIQAIVMTIGLILIGVKSAILWGVITFFVAFIPLIGTGLVWGPLILIYFLQEEYLKSILILTIGSIVASIDNILLPKFISEKTNIGPVIILISIIGGLELFGLYGILIGPFFLGFLFVLLEEVFIEIKRNFNQDKKFIWTEEEREKYRNLKTQLAKKEFAKLINKKYENTK